MHQTSIVPPFFEFGPKAYMYGRQLEKLTLAAQEYSLKYRVPVIITPQYSDIYPLAHCAPSLYICAQHMDPIRPGRGIGTVLPEAVRAAGARCVMLNHAEKSLSLDILTETLRRAYETELISIVCAGTLSDAAFIASLSPDIIIAEPAELIGSGQKSEMNYIRETTRQIKEIDSGILVLQGAGISDAQDVYDVICEGADAAGCSSAVAASDRPEKLLEEMICAVREAWDKRKLD